MAEEITRYVRKLSGEEALERYIMVLKDSLPFFPKPGVPFKIKIGDKRYQSQVKAIDCWCRGPKNPHVHYRIELSQFVDSFRPHFGQIVTIEKVRKNLYELH
jgi:hypothetical protein